MTNVRKYIHETSSQNLPNRLFIIFNCVTTAKKSILSGLVDVSRARNIWLNIEHCAEPAACFIVRGNEKCCYNSVLRIFLSFSFSTIMAWSHRIVFLISTYVYEETSILWAPGNWSMTTAKNNPQSPSIALCLNIYIYQDCLFKRLWIFFLT